MYVTIARELFAVAHMRYCIKYRHYCNKANEETNDSDQPLWNFAVEAKASRVAIRTFTFRPRVSGRFSPTRYAVAVRSMWLSLSSDLLSPAFQCELSLQHLGPVERQTLVCHHPPSHLQTSLARSRCVRRFLTICFRLDSEWSKQAWRHFLHPFAAFPTTCQ